MISRNTQVSFTLDITPELLDESIRQQAEQKARESYVMELLRHGRISSGYAAKLLNLSRVEMLERMGRYQISVFSEQTPENLAEEVAETMQLMQKNLV
jgi:predicted HTH domain antitoxin